MSELASESSGASWEGKVAVVTGGASGIGRGLALELVRRGAVGVAVADVNEARLDDVRAELGDAGLVSRCDVTSDADMDRFSDLVLDRFGRVDLLCNNAGVAVLGPAEHIAMDDWRWIIDINVLGLVRGVRAFVPHMIERGSGHVLNTASVAGTWAYTWDAAPYITSKFAAFGYSEALVRALRPQGVGVSVLCPGLITTNLGETARRSGMPEGFDGDYFYMPPEMLDPKDPAEVATMTLDAVEQGTFAIFTHAADAERFRTWRLDIDASLDKVIADSPAPPSLH